MDMTGEQTIPAKRERVWEALSDPSILETCIPGCEDLEKVSDVEMKASVTAKVGPVKAKFKGDVFLSELDPPNSYKITGEGKGGVAGFAKGGAQVTLRDCPEGTLLSYEVHATVGGKLAQLGSRLIDSTAKKMADDFFTAFTKELSQEQSGESSNEDLKDVPLDPGLIEGARTIAMENAPEGVVEAISDMEHAVEDKVKDVEEKLEVAAGTSSWGGPLMWGLGALLILLVLYAALSGM
ncbi:SRPBCC family protein [Flexibacterium corallicola]|uniref:SRPBCC family protein n=1 Tax=Flexibacterium corallicola TaxID=3037259 RepID=UPI0038620FF6